MLDAAHRCSTTAPAAVSLGQNDGEHQSNDAYSQCCTTVPALSGTMTSQSSDAATECRSPHSPSPMSASQREHQSREEDDPFADHDAHQKLVALRSQIAAQQQRIASLTRENQLHVSSPSSSTASSSLMSGRGSDSEQDGSYTGEKTKPKRVSKEAMC
jgi:hypothetical protein